MIQMGLAIRSGFEYYYYYPSLAAAVIFIICFVLTTLLHTFQLIRTKTWFFIPFLIGGYCKQDELHTRILSISNVVHCS